MPDVQQSVEAFPARQDSGVNPEVGLCHALSAGDEQAFRDFYGRFAGRLLALARRLSGDASLAEDMTQEVFLHLIRVANRFDGRAALATWVFRVATNHFISFLRKHGPRRGTFPLPEESGSASGLPPAPTRPVHQRLDLEDALRRLPDGFRTVVVLHDVQGYRHEEIAATLGIAPGTSKSQLHRARMRLRELLCGGRP